MSQIVTRKGPVKDDKEKRQTDSPVKEMKKKIAANAEKEKQAAEKNAEKPVQSDKKQEKAKENSDKPVEKPADKKDKQEKSSDKSGEKKDKVEKSDKKEASDKKETKEDKPAEKKEKPAEKKEVAQPEKSNENNKEKGGKAELPDEKQKKPEQKARENGAKVTNGEQNGDTVKAARTPETPRPASDKRDRDYVPDDSKLLKMKDDTPSSDRKLRSSDSPKPQDKKIEKIQEKKSESPKKDTLKAVQEEQKEDSEKDTNEGQKNEVEIDVVVEADNEDEARVKADTNFSKSRVKVSPYRRSARAADLDVSLVANYTGNNTTMEMDITETSSFMTEETPESPYLTGLRSIRGRRSYKPLKEMTKRNFGVNWITRSNASASEQPSRPTGTVVGRKRKPDADEVESEEGRGAEAEVEVGVAVEAEERRGGKRARLLDRLARPFRAAAAPLAPLAPLAVRRNAEIVGINTDLPLTVPVAGPDPFDPEAIKPPTPLAAPHVALAAPLAGPPTDRDAKRCVLM